MREPGDALYLTKPLGTALVLGGAKRGLADIGGSGALDANAEPRRRGRPARIRAERGHRRDGLRLAGHAHEMAERSGVRIVLDADRLPALDGALDAARAGVSTAGTRNNRDVRTSRGRTSVAPELVELAYDPQTAGGLLVSLPADKGMSLEAQFAAAGLFLARVGRVEDGAGLQLV